MGDTESPLYGNRTMSTTRTPWSELRLHYLDLLEDGPKTLSEFRYALYRRGFDYSLGTVTGHARKLLDEGSAVLTDDQHINDPWVLRLSR